jgi:uncharacterized phage-associated protein
MANVFDVAELMIRAAGEEGDITNLKLNKLLYFAQGTHLARTGKPLFAEEIEAWQLGPVVPAVYSRYKPCGRNPISAEGISDEVEDKFSEEEEETLIDVMLFYNKFSAGYLVNLTHADGVPWCATPQGQVISKKVLQRMNQFA